MKMRIMQIEYSNIRKISSLSLPLSNAKNTFIMMGNGTGKTTTMELIKGLLDGEAAKWSSEKVKQFQLSTGTATSGEFRMKVQFDESQYIYKLQLNYLEGTARIKTTSVSNRGEEEGLNLPESLRGIFTSEFVRRFVFDGEQAIKSLDSSSNEAEETIRYLYRLDELDEIIAVNEKILSDIQTAEGGAKGTDTSLSNIRTRQKQVKESIIILLKRKLELETKKKELELELESQEKAREEYDAKNKALFEEKSEIEKKIEINLGKIETKVKEIMSEIRSPYRISELLCKRMKELGMNMTKLKLPKASSKDFFVELANTSECICGRHIGDVEKTMILKNAERFLGSDQQAVLNEIKAALNACEYDSTVERLFSSLDELLTEQNRLNARASTNREKLMKAGGEKAREIADCIESLRERIGAIRKELSIIDSKDDEDSTLTEKNNLPKAQAADKEYDRKIASATRTNQAWQRKEVVASLINKIKERATKDLKTAIIQKTNERLREVIDDDHIEVEDIDKYIKLKGRGGASEGQTLSIAYCFLGALFEDSELDFPFVIDSPAGKMDFKKRKAVADIIPHIFNQLIAFVTSAEVNQFADRFYSNPDTYYVTVVAEGNNVLVHEGKEYFDSYQREHKEEE